MPSPSELVQPLREPARVNEVIRELTGSLAATELRRMELRPEIYDAFVAGLADPHPRVRWWCIQVLDHVADARAADAIAPLLDDPVARVRQNAAHALGCNICKGGRAAPPTPEVLGKLAHLARHDVNAKVRAVAARSCAAAPAG